jgi:hypothetical protein
MSVLYLNSSSRGIKFKIDSQKNVVLDFVLPRVGQKNDPLRNLQ